MKFAIATLAALPALLLAAPGFADEGADDGALDGVWFTGGTVGDSVSAYGGAVVALPGARLGKGFALRASANAGSYNYLSGAQQIDGDYVGGEVSLVYQESGEWGWANFSAGPRFTRTTLKPADPGNDRQGSRWDLGLQSDGALDGAKWRLGWLGSFGPFDEAFEARVDIGRKLGGGKYRIGAEAGILGDPAYTKKSAGAFVATPLIGRAELKIGGGATFQHGEKAHAYGSLGLSSVF